MTEEEKIKKIFADQQLVEICNTVTNASLLLDNVPPSRSVSMVKTKLDEAQLWMSLVLMEAEERAKNVPAE